MRPLLSPRRPARRRHHDVPVPALPPADARGDALQLAPAHDDFDAALALALAAGHDGHAGAVMRRLPPGAPGREAALHGFLVGY